MRKFALLAAVAAIALTGCGTADHELGRAHPHAIVAAGVDGSHRPRTRAQRRANLQRR